MSQLSIDTDVAFGAMVDGEILAMAKVLLDVPWSTGQTDLQFHIIVGQHLTNTSCLAFRHDVFKCFSKTCTLFS